ncbi:MAG: hypothetical protein ABSH09_19450 [Bryobacteraceae bacterium]
MRNHGFLWAGQAGWRPSPAYDLNPLPIDLKPRVLTTTIDLEHGTVSLELALDVASYFELTSDRDRAIAAKVGEALAMAKGGRQARPYRAGDRLYGVGFRA